MLTFKDILFAGPEAVCLVGMDLRIIECNQITNILLGLNDGDLNGKHLSDIFFDDNIIRNLTKKCEQDDWFQGEFLLKTGFGNFLPYKLRAAKLQKNNSQQEIYALIFSEIDELQRISNSQKINALKSILGFTLIPDKKPEDMLIEFAKVYDQNAIAFLLNSKFDSSESDIKNYHCLPSKQTYMMAQLALNNKILTFCHEENLWCFFPVCSERETYGVACIRFSTSRLYNDEDKIIFTLCGKVIGSNIEQRPMNSQPSYPESLLQIAFDYTKQPIIVVNKNGLITKVNNSAKAFYGYTEIEMLGKSFGDLVFFTDNLIMFDDLLNDAIEGNQINDKELIHVRSDLTTVDVSISVYACKADYGTISGAVFIIQDIGQKDRLKNKIAQLEKLSVLGELLYSAANELNNSLTSVIGHSGLLCHTKNDKITDIASKINEGSLRCGNVVAGLLDLAREGKTKKGNSSIDEVLRSVLDFKRYQLMSNNIHLTTKIDKNVSQVAVDFYDLERLILHIINYAERRMLEYGGRGELIIKVESDDKKAIISFIDTGTCILKHSGIAASSNLTLYSVSDEYTDVGLVSACQILKKAGGTIYINSQIGKNNVITIEIPTINEIPIKAEHENGLHVYIDVAGKSILLVDDETDIIELLTEFLQQKGYIIDVAKDGKEALDKALTKDYDVIVSDLKMPNGFTGDKLHRFVKQKNSDLAQKMIFMTGDIINPETQKFLQSTGNQYLEKPFLPENLIEKINQMGII